MAKKNNPNIFNFATSELSQDAFLCWLISWLRFPKGELHKCAKDLLILFHNKYQTEIIKSNQLLSDNQTLELVKIGNPDLTDSFLDVNYVLRQFKKIDIIFQVMVDGNSEKRITFVIEDKTSSEPGTGQLKRYKDIISNNELFLKGDIVLIYFKTGYVYESEEVKKDEFYLFDWEQISSFLSKYESITDPIFTSFTEYFRTNYYEKFKSNLAKLYEKDGFDNFRLDFFQWEFTTNLSKKCKEKFSIGNDKYTGHVYKGTSRGRPWTQYEFVKIKIKDYPSEIVYYRLQNMAPPQGKSGYCLRLCLYSKNDKKVKFPVDVKAKRKRLEKYRILFADCDIAKFDFEKKLSNSGDDLMEIARLHFDNHTNTIEAVLDKFPTIHSEFVTKISEKNLLGDIFQK